MNILENKKPVKLMMWAAGWKIYEYWLRNKLLGFEDLGKGAMEATIVIMS